MTSPLPVKAFCESGCEIWADREWLLSQPGHLLLNPRLGLLVCCADSQTPMSFYLFIFNVNC